MMLREWLSSHRKSVAVFAREVGAHKASAHRWVKHLTVPQRRFMKRITVLTRGAVTPNDFHVEGDDSVSGGDR